ncbi:hypothetical protein E3N88_39775 [Mikania micrantha]|uniref:Tf2-1-like SH3-like domain-containing protein n=1 Tax=Mikania micrantha TaxID=192012 RepID=A0A5N6LN15_9ASTR|nr:hypothetical protein E3N88_39775 [Mikania micrantha]
MLERGSDEIEDEKRGWCRDHCSGDGSGTEVTPLEFQVGDRVMLKVSPWKGVVRFGKKGKFAPRFVGPFEIIQRIGPVAYKLILPNELSGVHDVFHVSNLKKCLADESLVIPVEEIQVGKQLHFIEEPLEIMDREVKQLKRSHISIVKVRCNSKRGPKFTWEREDHMKSKLPLTASGHDSIWVIVDRLTKTAHFLPIREDYKIEKLVKNYLNEIASRHGVLVAIISDRDSRFTSRSPLCWNEIGESQQTGPEIIQETMDKIHKLKERLKVAHDRRKSYADRRRKPLEFRVGDKVMLKVSPHGRFELPPELEGIHDVLNVSNLKKCLVNENIILPYGESKINTQLQFMEEPVEIMDKQVKKLRRRRIPIVKVRWDPKRGSEFTWEKRIRDT